MKDRYNGDNDDISFSDAMEGVTRHRHDKADVAPLTAKNTHSIFYRRQAAMKEDEKVIDGLSDEAVELVESGEELIFANPGVQLRVLKKLKQGHIPWEQGIDLHGYTVDQARDQLSHFISDALRNQARCVIVVHGKAHSSGSEQALIKSYVNEWLKRLRGVLAFCSAQAKDGGTGALYVLLKREK
ncbi:Smr/MutS family protein [uncultured Neptuniibacter sp.]|uniref:Smr/MutS family protein n=1 Tax=uncultured Neptuniibacter sp. TaxID=502143 RepID=UPI00262BD80F|nr:Smr/MutS family protein [uncultured Neptuniibacter sp.]